MYLPSRHAPLGQARAGWRFKMGVADLGASRYGFDSAGSGELTPVGVRYGDSPYALKAISIDAAGVVVLLSPPQLGAVAELGLHWTGVGEWILAWGGADYRATPTAGEVGNAQALVGRPCVLTMRVR